MSKLEPTSKDLQLKTREKEPQREGAAGADQVPHSLGPGVTTNRKRARLQWFSHRSEGSEPPISRLGVLH